MLTCLIWTREIAKWLVFQTTFVRVLFVSGVPIPRDWTLLRQSIHASFRVCSCVYVNFSFMKRQQKLSLFLRQREWQRKVKIKVNWRRQMTKAEKLVQQQVNPQKLQNFQSSRRPQQVSLWENSVFIIIIIIWPRPSLKWPNLKCHVGHLTHFP